MAEERITGEVIAESERGIRIGDDWYIYSKFRQVERPNEGDHVEIVAKRKWIQALTFVRRINGSNHVDKQTKITRSALLNTALSILRTQNRPIEAEEVIETARELEPYIYGPPDTGEVFEDAKTAWGSRLHN
jgi:hypothetical protein